MNRNYILTKIKLNNIHGIYNTKDIKNNKQIKELFDYKKIKNNEYVFDEYTSILYDELINILYDCLKLQLQTTHYFIYKRKESDLNIIYKHLPKEIINVVEKNKYDDIKLEDVINIGNRKSPIMYYLSCYCESLQDVLEMFYETDKYVKTREKYLKRKEGIEERKLLNYINDYLKTN